MVTKVKQMISNNWNAIANQFIITDNLWNDFFQSYDSIIVEKRFDWKIYLDSRYWKYSNTTSKYRSQFLGETTKETQDKIDSGEYILTNLN